MSNQLKLLSEQTSRTCEWIGKGEGCGDHSLPNRNYCGLHVWRIYSQGTAVRRRPRKDRKQQQLEEFVSELNEAYAELIAEGSITP